MAPSQSSALQLAAHAFATIFVGFGVNAILRPSHALTFFEFAPPASPADARMVDSLMAVYGARDIFMGLAIYAAALFGTKKSLGWTLIASSGVAIVSFQRLRKPNSAITPTISTICSSVQYLRSSANMASVTAFGTDAAASAKSSVLAPLR